MSFSINLIVTWFNCAFSLAVFKASEEISIALIVAFVKFLANEMGMQPLPVPISRIVTVEF